MAACDLQGLGWGFHSDNAHIAAAFRRFSDANLPEYPRSAFSEKPAGRPSSPTASSERHQRREPQDSLPNGRRGWGWGRPETLQRWRRPRRPQEPSRATSRPRSAQRRQSRPGSLHCIVGGAPLLCTAGEPSAQAVAGRRAVRSNRPPESEQAGHDLTCPPRPHPSRHSRPRPKSHPHGDLTGPATRSILPLEDGLSVTLPRPLGPAPATGAILRASRPTRSLAAGNCLS